MEFAVSHIPRFRPRDDSSPQPSRTVRRPAARRRRRNRSVVRVRADVLCGRHPDVEASVLLALAAAPQRLRQHRPGSRSRRVAPDSSSSGPTASYGEAARPPRGSRSAQVDQKNRVLSPVRRRRPQSGKHRRTASRSGPGALPARGHRPVLAVDNASVGLARSHVHTGFTEWLPGGRAAGGAAVPGCQGCQDAQDARMRSGGCRTWSLVEISLPRCAITTGPEVARSATS